MRELPKIARDRLAAEPVHSAHLDANLITAFVERALLPDERRRVMGHMAVCEPCRAEVQLVIRATQTDPGAAESVHAALVEPRSWWRRGQALLGWRTASAVTAVAAISLAFWFATRQPRPHATRLASNASPPAPVTTAAEMAPRLAPSPNAAGSRRSGKSASQREVEKMLATEARANQPADGLKPGTDEVQVQAQPLSGNTPLPAPVRLNAREGAVEALAPAAPQAEGKLSFAALPPAKQPAAHNRAASPNGEGISPQQIERAQAVMSLQRTLAKSPAATITVSGQVEERAVRWTINATSSPSSQAGQGTVERSLDGGRTWQSVPVAAGVTFRVVFAFGRDVWAGGTAGAFFHSGDRGQHWSAIALPTTGGTVAGDITSIQFADAAHGVVSASSEQTWTTTDGGQSWQQAP
jgi:hypothetical protein